MSIPFTMNKMGGGSALPYTELQYLESTGDWQYLNTGIKIATDNQWLVKVKTTEQVSWIRLGSNDSNGNRFSIFLSDNSMYEMAIKTYEQKNASDFTQVDIVCFLNANTGTGYMEYSNKRVYWTLQPLSQASLVPLYLFTRNNGGTLQDAGPIKIYYSIIYKAYFTLQQELIPVLWKAGQSYTDGNTNQTVTPSAAKPGMYDTVSKKLFVNQGSGADFLYA